MTDETDLKLGDVVIPAGSGRGISQSLEPIENGQIRRTVNGTLIDLTREENRKYSSTISTDDQKSPAFDGMWRGQTLLVECIAELRQTVNPADAAATLIRDPVTGTIFGYQADGTKLNPLTTVGRDVTFSGNVVMVTFRPKMTFMIVSIGKTRQEYDAQESWSLELEEV